MLTDWPCPSSGALRNGEAVQELVVTFGKGRKHRVLIVPPLFDEHNKFRRQMVEIMRRLDLSGIDTTLPDLPGWNESAEWLGKQDLAGWRAAMLAAAEYFEATHVLSFRAGALLVPATLPGWRYAPTSGRQVLRSLLRARTISAREAGQDETIASLQELGRNEGIELAGWNLSPAMFGQLEEALVDHSEIQTTIDQSMIGGAGLWLRAEPDDDPEQADAIAAIVAIGLSEQ